MSQFQQLHNLVLSMVQFSFAGLMGTCVECGTISLLNLLVHLHISPWEWQRGEQPDVISHRLECTPIIKVYFASRGTRCIYSIVKMCMYWICWHERRTVCMVSLEMGSVFLCSFVERGAWTGNTWIAFPPNKQHAGGESKQITLRAFRKPMWRNPVRLYRYTDWLMGKYVTFDVDEVFDQMMFQLL